MNKAALYVFSIIIFFIYQWLVFCGINIAAYYITNNVLSWGESEFFLLSNAIITLPIVAYFVCYTIKDKVSSGFFHLGFLIYCFAAMILLLPNSANSDINKLRKLVSFAEYLSKHFKDLLLITGVILYFSFVFLIKLYQQEEKNKESNNFIYLILGLSLFIYYQLLFIYLNNITIYHASGEILSIENKFWIILWNIILDSLILTFIYLSYNYYCSYKNYEGFKVTKYLWFLIIIICGLVISMGDVTIDILNTPTEVKDTIRYFTSALPHVGRFITMTIIFAGITHRKKLSNII